MTDTIIEILIDASGSMGFMKGEKEHENKYLIDGQTRMSLIKKILRTDIIPAIDYSSFIYIRTFRSEKTDKEIQTPIIYKGIFDKLEIEKTINNLSDPPKGGSPITEAIYAAVNDLKNFSDKDRKIILLTDGVEDGNGNYIDAAKEAASLIGIPCKIFIVGIAQNNSSEAKAKEIANGGYINLNSTNFSAAELKIALAPIKEKILDDSLKNIQSAEATVIKPPQVQAEPIIQILKDKTIRVKEESRKAKSSIQLEQLENKIKEQVASSEKLLSEISNLKELIRLDVLLESGIDATTLTIDNNYSESIRKESETFLYKHLCEKHGTSNVNWLNETTESFSPYDFELLDEQGKTIQVIECKGTSKDKPTFYLTANEWSHFLANKEIYQVYRVFNVEGEMSMFCIENLFTSILEGQVVPYLTKSEIIKEGRVFLTLLTE